MMRTPTPCASSHPDSIIPQTFIEYLVSSTTLDFGDIVGVLNMTDKVPAFILKSYIQLGETDNKHTNRNDQVVISAMIKAK